MKTDLNKQRAAVAMAMKDKQRELVKATESKDAEWISDCEHDIICLSDAVDTLKMIEQFSLLIQMISPTGRKEE